MTQTVSRWVRSQASTCTMYGEQSVNVKGFPPGTSVSPVSIIPPMFHTHFHLHADLTRRTNGRNLGAFQKAMFRRKSGSAGYQITFTPFLVLIYEYSQDCWLKVSRHQPGPATGQFDSSTWFSSVLQQIPCSYH